MKSRVRLAEFGKNNDFERGRGKAVEIFWYLIKCFFFLSPLPWPSSIKVRILRVFGAKVGSGVYIKPRVNIHFPWRLEIGDDAWIGEEANLLSFELIKIGANCCVSQRAFLCCGNHDYRISHMPYRNAPITLKDGSWVGAQVFVGPGAVLGYDSIAVAGSVLSGEIPDGEIYGGNPAKFLRRRWKDDS